MSLIYYLCRDSSGATWSNSTDRIDRAFFLREQKNKCTEMTLRLGTSHIILTQEDLRLILTQSERGSSPYRLRFWVYVATITASLVLLLLIVTSWIMSNKNQKESVLTGSIVKNDDVALISGSTRQNDALEKNTSDQVTANNSTAQSVPIKSIVIEKNTTPFKTKVSAQATKSYWTENTLNVKRESVAWLGFLGALSPQKSSDYHPRYSAQPLREEKTVIVSLLWDDVDKTIKAAEQSLIEKKSGEVDPRILSLCAERQSLIRYILTTTHEAANENAIGITDNSAITEKIAKIKPFSDNYMKRQSEILPQVSSDLGIQLESPELMK